MEDAYKDREASQDNVLSQVRCDPRVTTFQSSLLSVFDWGTAVDGGIGKGEYLFGDFDHVAHLALPREGHLDQLFHMFAHLKKYHNAKAGIQLDCAGL